MSLISVTAHDPLAGWCIGRTLPLEGAVSDNPADPGGITSHGVSLRWALSQIALHPDEIRLFDIDHDGHLDRRDIAGLTADEAADIFYECWWTPGWYRSLSPQMICWKCFDIAVNTGPQRSALILQAALARSGETVSQDGAIGPATLAAVRRQAQLDGGTLLLTAIRGRQVAFYQGLVDQKPKLQRFEAGWLRRAMA